MLVLIDNAEFSEIEALYHDYPYDGVTTNPSILMKAHKNPIELLKKIRAFLPKECQLHAQLVSETTDQMIEEAHFMLHEISDELFVKVPVTTEGLRATRTFCQAAASLTTKSALSKVTPLSAIESGSVNSKLDTFPGARASDFSTSSV